MMKMIFLATMLLGCSLAVPAQSVTAVSDPAQVKDDLLAGTEVFAKDAKEVSEVNVDPKAMAMLATSADKADLVQKIRYTVIRSYQYDAPGKYRREDFDAISNRLNDGSWSCVVRERSKTESTDICMKSDPRTEMNEFVIMTAEPKEVNFIHIKGRMSFDDLGKMGGAITPGLKKHGK